MERLQSVSDDRQSLNDIDEMINMFGDSDKDVLDELLKAST